MRNKIFFVTFGILLVATLLSTVSAEYMKSGVQYSSPGSFGLFGGSTSIDRSACEAGQDFFVQVSPLGCTPVVVRSDLI